MNGNLFSGVVPPASFPSRGGAAAVGRDHLGAPGWSLPLLWKEKNGPPVIGQPVFGFV